MQRNEQPQYSNIIRPNNPLPFGDYGRSDLNPFNGPSTINSSGGTLIGPNNPIFNNPNQFTIPNMGPGIRFDPIGPPGFKPIPDDDIFMPPNNGGMPFGKKGNFGGSGFGNGFGGGPTFLWIANWVKINIWIYY